jgi:hypothetical protein
MIFMPVLQIHQPCGAALLSGVFVKFFMILFESFVSFLWSAARPIREFFP